PGRARDRLLLARHDLDGAAHQGDHGVFLGVRVGTHDEGKHHPREGGPCLGHLARIDPGPRFAHHRGGAVRHRHQGHRPAGERILEPGQEPSRCHGAQVRAPADRAVRASRCREDVHRPADDGPP
ncbi:MAG: hypothetical protein ACK55I_22705, partial [bacterium]